MLSSTMAVSRRETIIARRNFCWRALGCASLLFLCLLCGTALGEEPRFFRIGTAATAGSFFEIGGVLASAISSPPGSPMCGHGGTCGVPGLVAVAQTTQGSIENLRLINAGQIESGFSQADLAGWAYKGTGAFSDNGPMPRLRVIAGLFPESLHIVVLADSSIHSLADLKGKRVSIGEPESGTVANARVVLAASGLDGDKLTRINLRPSQAAAQLTAGTIDAFFMVGVYPVPAIRELAATTPIRLVPIDNEVMDGVQREFGFYDRAVIPAASYPGIDSDTPTVGFSAMWIVGADVDGDLVYALTKSLWNETTLRLLAGFGPIGRTINPRRALTGLSVPLHPGAERYYREIGLPVENTPRVAEDGHENNNNP